MCKREPGEPLRACSGEIFALAQEAFSLHKNFKILVTGNSMYPFIRHEIDSVELQQAGIHDVKIGDIVLACNKEGKYILHRMLKNDDRYFYMMGDGQSFWDAPYAHEEMIAKVVNIYRRGRKISVNQRGYRALARIWRLFRFARDPILRFWKKCRVMYHRNKSRKARSK